ncbi:hypothetical protein CesoFtcFv8_008301 [Champsocephalus esox]|uniref:Uncharacterized protein n=1 Tax=Champsocephalus esox TaxID=159716 RepID=A0AAN8CBX4_9TELE|nr:hypothetical protein CesoFtcFv8_008301 [Champsocephalus esox]
MARQSGEGTNDEHILTRLCPQRPDTSKRNPNRNLPSDPAVALNGLPPLISASSSFRSSDVLSQGRPLAFRLHHSPKAGLPFIIFLCLAPPPRSRLASALGGTSILSSQALHPLFFLFLPVSKDQTPCLLLFLL